MLKSGGPPIIGKTTGEWGSTTQRHGSIKGRLLQKGAEKHTQPLIKSKSRGGMLGLEKSGTRDGLAPQTLKSRMSTIT